MVLDPSDALSCGWILPGHTVLDLITLGQGQPRPAPRGRVITKSRSHPASVSKPSPTRTHRHAHSHPGIAGRHPLPDLIPEPTTNQRRQRCTHNNLRLAAVAITSRIRRANFRSGVTLATGRAPAGSRALPDRTGQAPR